MPRAVFGAATDSYILANAGTEPTCAADDQCMYRLDRYGWVDGWYTFVIDNTPSGANAIALVLPYIEFQSGGPTNRNFANGFWTDASTIKMLRYQVANGAGTITSFVADGTTTALTNASFANADTIRLNFRYRAFDTNEA